MIWIFMSPNSISVLTRNYCEKQDEKNRGKFFLTFSDTEETRDLLLLNFFSSKVPISLVPSSGSVAPHSKANSWGASVCSKERCFIQKSWQSGEKADLCPETNSKDWSAMKIFQGKKWNIFSERSTSLSFFHFVQFSRQEPWT